MRRRNKTDNTTVVKVSMNTQEIAQTILDRRNRMNPVIMSGEMIAALGAEGMQEALQRRWLLPDTDTGYLQVSNDLASVEELRTAAETPAPKQVESVVVDQTHNIALSHAHRNINELLAPGTGHDNSAPFRPQQPATSPAEVDNRHEKPRDSQKESGGACQGAGRWVTLRMKNTHSPESAMI